MKIDFVSDVVCPWCVIGLHSLDIALQRLGPDVAVDLHFQPFELNPRMPAQGQEITEHLQEKYGSTPEQLQRNRETIRERAAELGFEFNMDRRSRTWNTFDAHRLLHWAELQGHQRALKQALFKAYFTDGENPGAHAVLLRLAGESGLDPVRAQQILASGEYGEAVRERQSYYQQRGIRAVPAVIINDRHLISGGQPPEVFEQALRRVLAEV